ncbi:TPA: 3'-phosphoesterase [Candidatus Woesearchaeota archaeon]|nr:3'-phosphoesterase [Candidatus Woesearchaeota archaeon]HIH32555.1 3'-phosphoesterase [Candidatus Woesearchaeota archaeon]HIH54756.1 3'-phosphoesterase [Candidatus Woesearchaeota archaeon]HIJ01738.1 3'-phosphoesterase [Candidatus Woesearchaeota archaeon]HIJ13947.1 3'-phosphoesterase [Candidatus Woesearchaeota archaeon]
MPRFVVHEHHARNLHYDLRLELDNVLKSWAVPKEPPLVAGIKRLAIQVDDHDLSYIGFKGAIEEGYGKGTVKIWDKGNYEIESRKEKKLAFILKGRKMKGRYVLLKFEKAKNGWLLFKKD